LDSRRAILLFKCGSLYEKKFANDVAGMKKAISYYERYALAANLPPTNKLVRKIPVLKEMIEKGMIGPVKEDKSLKAPEGDGTAPAGDAMPTKDAATPAPAATEPAPAPKTDEAPAKDGGEAKKEEGK